MLDGTFVFGRESQGNSPENIKLTVNWRCIYTECVFSSLWNWWRWFIVITFFSFWWIRKIWFIITFCVWVVRAYFENIILNALILKTIKGMIVCMENILIFNDITKFNGFRVKTTFFIFRVATWNLLLGTLILHVHQWDTFLESSSKSVQDSSISPALFQVQKRKWPIYVEIPKWREKFGPK